MSYRINGPVTLGDTGTDTVLEGDVQFPNISTTEGELFTVNAAGSLVSIGAGTAGQILTSNGAGAVPTFQAGNVSIDDNFSVTKVAGDSFTDTPTVVPNWSDATTGSYQTAGLPIDTTTGIATAGVSGKYAFSVVLNYANSGASGNTGSRTLELFVNAAVVRSVTTQPTGSEAIDQVISMSGDILLTAADTISVRFYRSDAGTTNNILGTTTWSMHRFA